MVGAVGITNYFCLNIKDRAGLLRLSEANAGLLNGMGETMREFTTIVVGAGSAGAVIAARMTESSEHNVLLIDAGPDYVHPANLPSDLANGKAQFLGSPRLELQAST